MKNKLLTIEEICAELGIGKTTAYKLVKTMKYVKGERELLLEDGNGLVAFGIEGVEAPAKGIFIYFRTERRHVFLFGSRESCSVHNLDALPPKQLEDDVYVIEDIFSTNYETRCMVGFNEEVDA